MFECELDRVPALPDALILGAVGVPGGDHVIGKPSIGAASVLEKMVIHDRRGPRAVGLA